MKTKTKTKLSKPVRIKFVKDGRYTVVNKDKTKVTMKVGDGQTLDNVRLGAQNKFMNEQDLHLPLGGIIYSVHKSAFITDEPAKISRPIHCPKCAEERGVAIPKHCPHHKEQKKTQAKTDGSIAAVRSLVTTLEEQMNEIEELGGIVSWSMEAHRKQAGEIHAYLNKVIDDKNMEQLRYALNNVGNLAERVMGMWIACNPAFE